MEEPVYLKINNESCLTKENLFFFFITFRCLEEITIYKDLRKEEIIKEREGG